MATNCDLRDANGTPTHSVFGDTALQQLGSSQFFRANVTLFDASGHPVQTMRVDATVSQENGVPVARISNAETGGRCSANLINK